MMVWMIQHHYWILCVGEERFLISSEHLDQTCSSASAQIIPSSLLGLMQQSDPWMELAHWEDHELLLEKGIYFPQIIPRTTLTIPIVHGWWMHKDLALWS